MSAPIDNGGTAFPITGTHEQVLEIGMSLRDYFAAKAMQAWQANPTPDDTPITAVAEWSYRMADAMLKARSA